MMVILVKCAVCGKEIKTSGKDPQTGEYIRFYVCSKKCNDEFERRVKEISKKLHPELYSGKTLILDPAVGDEIALARIILEGKISDILSFNVRLERFIKEASKYGINKDTARKVFVCFHMVAVGENFADFMINGKLYRVFFSGEIKETKGYGYYWVRENGYFREVRSDYYKPRIIMDDELHLPLFGEIENSDAISLPELLLHTKKEIERELNK